MSSDPARFPAALAVALCLLMAFAGITNHGAWRSDEPRVAAICLEMSVSNNFVVPHLANEAFVEKPPLFFAMGAVLTKCLGGVLGPVGSARMASCLCGLLTLFFGFLLARRLLGKDQAWLSVMILATTSDIVGEFHVIRVDVALLLFVTAGAWSIAEVYLGGRSRFLLLAGLFAGLAFLTKGVVALAFLGIIWLSAFLPWAWPRWKQRHTERPQFMITGHLGAVAVGLGVLALWIIPFVMIGGQELWKQWFWDNQVGRVLGTSQLGHTRYGPFFYLALLLVSPLPWTPLLAVWVWRRCFGHGTRKKLSREHILLIGWSAGSLLLLTIASSKRGLYFLPVVPPLALMVAEVMARGLHGWQRPTYRFAAMSCVLWLAAQLAVPSLANLSPSPPTGSLLLGFIPPSYGGDHVVLLAAFLAAVYLLFWFPAPLSTRVICVIAITYASFFTVNFKVMDTRLGLEGKVRSFLSSIPEPKRKTAASFGLDERTRARFYLCDQQVFPAVELGRVNQILTGKDPKFDSVIVLRANSLQKISAPHRVMAKVDLDDTAAKNRDRWAYWLLPPPVIPQDR